jgi:alkyl sulfatase BDS1-like metallo-beta-lactamase superfamily hydrolase
VGAGPFLDQRQPVGLVPPSTLVDDRLEIELAGVRLEIVWVPSEAPDEIAVWLPGLGVLQTAECIQGECYPNLYTLRGDVPPPGGPVGPVPGRAARLPRPGAGQIARPQRGGRAGVPGAPAQLPGRHRLDPRPDGAADEPGLHARPDRRQPRNAPHPRGYETTGIEGYGSVPLGSRMIYAWYLGFNQGEVTDFDPAPYDERQRNYVAAMGGADRVLELARQAMDRGDNRWAIEILGYLVRSQPGHDAARKLDAEAHRREGLAKHNATWRNWYLTAAEELEGRVPAAVQTSSTDILSAQPLASIIAALPVRLRAELAWYVEQTLVLDIAGDEPGVFTPHLRRGVLEVLDGADDDAGATVRFTDKAALVAYLTGTALEELVASSWVKIDGDREAVARFGAYLDPPPDPSRILVTLHGPAR